MAELDFEARIKLLDKDVAAMRKQLETVVAGIQSKGDDLQEHFNKITNNALKNTSSVEDGIKNAVTNINEEIKAINADPFEAIMNLVGSGELSNVVGSVNDLKQAKTIYEGIGKTIEKLTNNIEYYGELTTKNNNKIKEYKTLISETKEDMAANNITDPYSSQAASIQKYTAEIKKLQLENATLSNYTQTNETNLKSLGGAYSEVGQKVESLSQKNLTLVAQIRQNKEQLLEMEQAGQKGSVAYNKLKKETIDLTLALSKQNSEMTAYRKGGAGMQATVQTLQTVSGAYSAALGASALFNKSVEEQSEIQTKLQSTIAMTTGLQSVYESLQKQSSLMTGIYAMQTGAAATAVKLKTAAEGKSIVVTKAATIAQKIFNAVARANPYVLLAMAIVTVVGALTAFAYGSSKAKRKQEELNDSIRAFNEQMNMSERAHKQVIDTMEAQGATQDDLRRKKREYANLEAQEAEDEYNRLYSQNRLYKNVSAEQLKAARELAEAKKIAAQDLKHQNKNDAIREEKEIQEAVTQAVKKATEERLAYERNLVTDKKKLIDIDKRNKINAINEERDAFLKANEGKGDTSSFDQRIATVKLQASFDKKQVNKEFEDLIKSFQAENNQLSFDIDIADLQYQLELTDNQNEKLKLQSDIRKKILDNEIKSLEIEKKKAVEETTKQYGKDAGEKVAKQYDAKIALTQVKINDESEAQEYLSKIERTKQYAEKLVEIEQWKEEEKAKIRKDFEENKLTQEEADAKNNDIDTIATIKQEQEQEALGISDKVSSEMMAIVEGTVTMGLETLRTQLPILRKNLEELKTSGANTTDIAKASATLAVAENELSQATDAMQSTSSESATDTAKKLKKVSTALDAVGQAIDVVDDCFGDMFGDVGKDAMSVIKTVYSAVSSVVSSIIAVTATGVSSVQAMESASVIIAIISAALQVITAIVKVFKKYFDENVKLQEAVDASKEHVAALEQEYRKLERAVERAIGIDKFKESVKGIENLKKQSAELYKQQRLNEEMASNAKGNEKKEYEQAAKEAGEAALEATWDAEDQMRENLEELITTNLSSFSENLADSIVDGFASGMQDMTSVFNEAFDDLMKGMIAKQMQTHLIDKALEPFFKQMEGAMADYTLTDSEAAAIKDGYANAKGNIETGLESYKSMMEELGLMDNESGQEAQSKGFQAMSQDTGDELNGRFTAIQISTASIDMNVIGLKANSDALKINSDMMIPHLNAIHEGMEIMQAVARETAEHLRSISDNTALLHETNKRLRNIEEYTSKI